MNTKLLTLMQFAIALYAATATADLHACPALGEHASHQGSPCSSGKNPVRPDYDSLLGTYSIKHEGKTIQVLRVEKSNGRYVSFEMGKNGWRDSAVFEPMADKEFTSITKHGIDWQHFGLSANSGGIFKVPKGFSVSQSFLKEAFRTGTGYFLFIGPAAAYLELTK